jgi:hypothetical protein
MPPLTGGASQISEHAVGRASWPARRGGTRPPTSGHGCGCRASRRPVVTAAAGTVAGGPRSSAARDRGLSAPASPMRAGVAQALPRALGARPQARVCVFDRGHARIARRARVRMAGRTRATGSPRLVRASAPCAHATSSGPVEPARRPCSSSPPPRAAALPRLPRSPSRRAAVPDGAHVHDHVAEDVSPTPWPRRTNRRRLRWRDP